MTIQSLLDEAQLDNLHNGLLHALSKDARARIAEDLIHVDLDHGQILYEPGDPVAYLYFPIDAIISMLYVMEDGSTAEIAMVGREGMAGFSLYLGGESTPHQAVVTHAGSAYRLRSRCLRNEVSSHGELDRQLLRYTQALVTQIAQRAACNRHHSIDQQLCRWLLSCLDRLPDEHIRATQEWISIMLGVRREGVTEAACRLQQAGVIGYQRGRIQVLDRRALERRCCECYSVVKEECDRLIPSVAPDGPRPGLAAHA